LHCNGVKEVWKLANSHKWINIGTVPFTQNNIPKWLTEAKIALPSIKMDRIIALLWSKWKTRNSVEFRNESSNPGITLIRANKGSTEW